MRYYMIAGEASGDLHGSNLIKGLVKKDPASSFRIWGGDLMLQAASERGTLVHHYKDDAVMGLSDVLGRLGRLTRNIADCRRDISGYAPDVVILIDYPGFNFRIARYAHRQGLRVFYYIAPKTWASREGRNRLLKEYVDRLFIVFPFEIPYFEERGIPFIYKGNPLLDAIDSHSFTPPSDRAYIALLPGSRKGEISRMMPVCMEVADRLGQDIIIAGAPSRSIEDYAPYIEGRRNVKVIFDRTYDILRYAQCAIINSGTASLEAALIGTPQVVCWSASALTIFAARHILKVGSHIRYISLGNLILDRPAFRELIQEAFTPTEVANEVTRLCSDIPYRTRMLSDYTDIRNALGGSGASESAAGAMIEEISRLSPENCA